MAYTKEQMALIKILVDTEKCTVSQIAAITGIPFGSVGMLASRAGATFVGPRKPGKSHLARIKEARKIVVLKEKYATVLTEHFSTTKPVP